MNDEQVRDLAWRQFMNGLVLQNIQQNRNCRYKGHQIQEHGNSKIVLVAGLIELLFWLFVVIVFGGTVLMSLCGLVMIVFNID